MNDHTMMDGDLAGATTTKLEVDREGTPSSIGSTPELEQGAEASQEPAQPQKRKGGRKPIYATSEERKQRNRQAQAAFRERRTEYIKQLEANIKQNEELLTSLQENHRRINNDCLMLRYKNSLLERILLENGIDVQAELEMKQGSPALSTGFMNSIANLPQSTQIQRTALQRQQARLSGSRTFMPKLAPGQQAGGSAAAAVAGELGFATSPHAHPTPSSHASSPSQLSTRSSMAMHQGQSSSPQALARPPHPPRTASAHAYHNSAASGISTHSGASSLPGLPPPPTPNAAAAAAAAAALQSASSFYPSPFQKHFDQLDQEYDAQTSRSMLDDPDQDDDGGNHLGDSHVRAGPSAAAAASQPQQQQPQLQLQQQQQQQQPQQSSVADYYTIQHHHNPPATQQQQQQQQPHHRLHPHAPFHPHLAFDPTTGAPLMGPTSHPALGGGVANGAGGDADDFSAAAMGAAGQPQPQQPQQPFQIDPNDPLLDQDPFGLSASMHYPTAYSFEQPHTGGAGGALGPR